MAPQEPDKLPLMVVDDEPDNLDLLYRTFRREFSVYKASSGFDALEQLEQLGEMAVIISDQRMPRMNGTEFLRRTVERFPDTIRIVLTGYTDVEDLVEAINSGQVFKYITKPWNPEQVKRVVLQAAETYQAVKHRTRILQRALRRESLENEVMRLVRESLDYYSMLQTVVDTFSTTFQADYGVLRPSSAQPSLDSPKLLTALGAKFDLGSFDTAELEAYSAGDHGPLQANQVSASSFVAQEQPVVALTLALTHHQRPLADIWLYRVGATQWDPETPVLLESIAGQTALAIAQAQLYQQVQEQSRQMRSELDVARQIQTNLLRQSWPSVPGVKLQAQCRPAREVGGDFFEIYPHPGGDIWLAVGDVSGKGVPAALFMASALSVLRRELAQEQPPDPELLMQQLNHSLSDGLVSNNCFITLVLSRYSPKTRRLTYANAGHILPLVWSSSEQRAVPPADSSPQYLETRGVPLGIVPIWKAPAGELTLSPGQTLLLTSDGLVEVVCQNGSKHAQGAMLHQSGLWQIIQQQPPPLDLARLLAAIQSLSDTQEDDQTVLSLEVLA